MRVKTTIGACIIGAGFISGTMGCKGEHKEKQLQTSESNFQWELERFGDLRILRYQVPGFDSLSLNQKKLIYFLSEAALCGRDIIYDQNFKHNLVIRRTLEAVYEHYTGDKDAQDFKALELYLKRVWFSNGIHHHYSMDKFMPEFSAEFFASAIKALPASQLPLADGEDAAALIAKLKPILFDSLVAAKRVVLDEDKDIIATSANNYYENVTQLQADAFYAGMHDEKDTMPISHGLNSKLVSRGGKLTEQVYSANGMYGAAIQQIVHWLEKAQTVAENPQQEAVIASLIKFYNTGDLKQFDDYSVLWVQDTQSRIDFVNGFIEVYGDPIGIKASWESLVNFKDIEATKRTEIISSNAQWFEDNSPVDSRFKKTEVKGVTAKVITAAIIGGDCYPATPIGINLPNSAWIRKYHGSKSVTIENITYAYDKASVSSGFLDEFCYSDEEKQRARSHGFLGGNLHTDMHECLGHGSGQSLDGVRDEALKNYYSTIEEARADLFALYYIIDPKLIELGLVPSEEVGKSEYDSYIRNGLMTQLRRIELGKNIEESHMRNRQLIAKWVYEKAEPQGIIEKKVKDGKTFFVINDYQKLRGLFGELLAEIQRMKSEGDYAAARLLVEQYGVKVDVDLHKEVLLRFEKLNLPSYSGFINPRYIAVYEDGQITDIKLEYQDSYAGQMLWYSTQYSFLPHYN